MPTSGNSEPARWQKLGTRLLTHTRIFDVQSVLFQHPAQKSSREFFVIHAPDWVNVVALTTERHLVLVRQFRHGANEFSLEIPGGMVDPGEDPVAAGVRELREETGFTGVRARLMGSAQANPAMQNNRCHYVLVEEAARTDALGWDENEEMEISTRPVDEVYAMALDGGISHALVLAGLLLFNPIWTEIKQRGVV